MNESPITDVALSATLQATPLAALLESAATPHQVASYRGVLTPLALDAPAAETAALASSAGIHDLGWLKRVMVRGEDSVRWLSGMVTNTVKDLAPRTGAWNLVLNAQGRIQGDLTVWCEPGGPENSLELEIAADQYDKLTTHLNRFIIMDDVELFPPAGEAPGEVFTETAIGLTGPEADAVLGRLSLPTLAQPLTSTSVEWNGLNLRIMRGYSVLAPHYELWVQESHLRKLWNMLRTAGATPVGCATVEGFRIAEGIPTYGVDIIERDLPQETSQTRALHFNKGCYLGQEIVERIRSRGSVHRHLRQLELTGPVPEAGAELFSDGAPDGASVGRITSAVSLPLAAGARVFALAMIRGEAEQRGQTWTYTAAASKGTAQLLDTPPNLR